MVIRTKIRQELKRKNERLNGLYADVERLTAELTLSSYQLKIEKGANKAHVANLQALVESSDKSLRIREDASLALLAELNELRDLERSYTQRLGEMARLCDIVCTWVLEHCNLEEESPGVKAAAEEIMEYVEGVRP